MLVGKKVGTLGTLPLFKVKMVDQWLSNNLQKQETKVSLARLDYQSGQFIVVATSSDQASGQWSTSHGGVSCIRIKP